MNRVWDFVEREFDGLGFAIFVCVLFWTLFSGIEAIIRAFSSCK